MGSVKVQGSLIKGVLVKKASKKKVLQTSLYHKRYVIIDFSCGKLFFTPGKSADLQGTGTRTIEF